MAERVSRLDKGSVRMGAMMDCLLLPQRGRDH